MQFTFTQTTETEMSYDAIATAVFAVGGPVFLLVTLVALLASE